MKKIYTLVLVLAATLAVHSQNAFWYENFGTGCNQGFKAHNALATPSIGMWSVTSFSLPFMNGPDANEWFISAQEQSQAVGVCGGITCGGSNNRSLHVGAYVLAPPPGIIDIGADYESGPLHNTNKRANTPLINTTGHYNIQLSFKYMAEGIPGNDYCEIEYSNDGGLTWYQLVILPPTTTTLCTQGTWAFYSVGLPSVLDNNPNVKIGFHWYNNDPTGAHPSIAIDDMALSELTMTTSSSVDCSTAASTASLSNIAIGNNSFTWTAMPNTVTFTPNSGTTTSIQFPSNGTYTLLAYGSNSVGGAATSTAMSVVTVVNSLSLNVASNSSVICQGGSALLTASGATSYTWNTSANTSSITVSPSVTTTYTVTGKNGHCITTATVQQVVNPCTSVKTQTPADQFNIWPNPFNNKITIATFIPIEFPVKIYNAIGTLIYSCKTENGKTEIDLSEQASGIYFVKIGSTTRKIVKQ